MLDAFIIERIRREREARESDHAGNRIPARVEIDGPPHPGTHTPTANREEQGRERGVIIIDFNI